MNVKTNKQKLATKPFFIFPTDPFFNSFVPFAVLLAMGVPMSEYVNNADFLWFFESHAKVVRQALTITCGWRKVSYLLG